MVKKTFKAEHLRELLYGDNSLGLEVVRDRIDDESRWSIIHCLIFKQGDTHYRTEYSVGKTEQQEETPFQDMDDVECFEVRPVTRTVTAYEDV